MQRSGRVGGPGRGGWREGGNTRDVEDGGHIEDEVEVRCAGLDLFGALRDLVGFRDVHAVDGEAVWGVLTLQRLQRLCRGGVTARGYDSALDQELPRYGKPSPA